MVVLVVVLVVVAELVTTIEGVVLSGVSFISQLFPFNIIVIGFDVFGNLLIISCIPPVLCNPQFNNKFNLFIGIVIELSLAHP